MTEDTPFNKRILVPLDGTELAKVAIPYALALAGPTSVVTIFRAASDEVPQVELVGTPGFHLDQVFAERQQEVQSYLRGIAGKLRESMGDVETDTSIGEPAVEILHAAERGDADLIVLATHGRGMLGRMLVGSVGDRVARESKIPVMLIHERGKGLRVDKSPSFTRVVVLLDGSERSRSALPMAVQFAQHFGALVRLIRVLPSFEERQASYDDLTEADYNDHVASAADRLAAEARRLHAKGVEASSEVTVGTVIPTILGALDPDDLVAMTSHGEGGAKRWLLGSVAEQLIHIGATPVLLVPLSEREALNQSMVT